MMPRIVFVTAVLLLVSIVARAGELSIIPVINAVTYSGPELTVMDDRSILASIGEDLELVPSKSEPVVSELLAKANAAEAAVDSQLELIQVVQRTESKLRALKQAIGSGKYDPNNFPMTELPATPLYQDCPRTISYGSTGSSSKSYGSTGSSSKSYGSTGSLAVANYGSYSGPSVRVNVTPYVPPVPAISRVGTGRC